MTLKSWFPGEVFTIHFMENSLLKIKSRICFQVLDYPMWNLRSRGGPGLFFPRLRQIPQDKAAESPDSGAMLPAPRSESSLRVLENKAPEVRRRLCQWKLWDGWMDGMHVFFGLSSRREKGHWGFFFKHFVFKVGDGWMVFWIQEKYEHFGKILACCMEFFSPTWTLQGVPNGWERVPFKTPPIGGCWYYYSLLFNFSGFVLKRFREGSLIFGGEEDPKNHSTGSNHSNSWLIQVREIPLRSHVLKMILLP